jgi:hypothetical protein
MVKVMRFLVLFARATWDVFYGPDSRSVNRYRDQP